MSEAIANGAVLAQVDVALDAVLDLRVLLHHERRDGRLTVPHYLAGLRAVREVERDLEELRPGEHSRAFELCVEEDEAKPPRSVHELLDEDDLAVMREDPGSVE